jgi:hypothetical protein
MKVGLLDEIGLSNSLATVVNLIFLLSHARKTMDFLKCGKKILKADTHWRLISTILGSPP